MTSPVSIRIRTYQVGFGDCFLLSFEYAEGAKHVLIDFGSTGLPEGVPKTRMTAIAKSIAERVGDDLVAVVATHRHQDHISGFAPAARGRGSGDIIRDLKPKLVLQPWTEDPDLPTDATGPDSKVPGRLQAMALHAASLAAMQETARALLAEAKRGRYLQYLPSGIKEQIGFLGENNLPNAGAVRNLMEMGRNEYLHAGKRTKLERQLPGVEVHVLGPPTVDQSAAVKKQRATDPDQFWHMQAAAGSMLAPQPRGKVAPLFPDHVRARTSDGFPIDARWMIHHVRKARGDQMLRIVRMLDKAMNNTSLILLFRTGSKSLLFPGDAQIENWAYALSDSRVQKMLRDVDLYKVGHHGSLNATPKDLWNLFARRSKDDAPGRLASLMSTMPGKHGSEERRTEVPRRTLKAALDRESDLFSTEELNPSELFHETVIEI